MKSVKYGSRKFIALIGTCAAAIILPIGYHIIGVDPSVTTLVIIVIGGTSAAYTGFNVLGKRYGDYE